MKQKEKKPRLFRWALWWGLGITLVSIALLFIPGIDDGQDPVSDVMYTLLNINVWFMFIVIGIIGPILEEVTFRLWGNGKRVTGIVSSVLMALFLWLTFNWYIGLAALVAALVVVFLVKERKRQLFCMMILSSIFFMIAHVGNYSGHFLATALALVEKFGFGLLAAYLVINHNILWSMALHILNNTLACIAIYASIAAISPTTFTEEGNFQVTLRPLILDHSTQLRYWPDCNGDTITYNNALDVIAVNILEGGIQPSGIMDNDSLLIYEESKLHVNYEMQVVFEPGVEHDLTAVVHTLERNGWLQLDTTVQQAYMLTILDSTLRIDPDSADITIWAGAYTFKRYGMPVIEPEGFNFKEWPVEFYNAPGTIEEAQQLLAPYGLGLEPTSRSMTAIRVTTLHDPLAD